MKQQVITIHGINTDGLWQQQVKRVLEPHFQCVEIKYGLFRNLGWLALIFDPGVLLLLLPTTYGLMVLDRKFLDFAGEIWVALPVSFFLVAYGFARLRLARAVKVVMAQLEDKEHPLHSHLIAHSLGTFLIGSILKKYPATRFDRIVLTGSVLPRCFDWTRVRTPNRNPFRALRNEVGKKDLVSWAAFLTYPFALGLGCSGAMGFWKGVGIWRGIALWKRSKRSDLVHSTLPFEVCGRCVPAGQAPIHNVEIDEFTHSDHFISKAHAKTFWLPFLWGIEPYEFRKLLDLCQIIASGQENRELDVAEAEIGRWRWKFLADRTLVEEIRRKLGAQTSEEEVTYALYCVCTTMAKAYEEGFGDEPREEVVLALKPEIAITDAVGLVQKNGASGSSRPG